MASIAKQKIKLLYLMQVLLSSTDENKHLTTQDLINYLEELDISVERKTIFDDIATLKDFGLDIEVSKKKDNPGYYVVSRDFELAEIKLICDAILSSRFITEAKSKKLIEKLETLVGPSQRKELNRNVFVQGRIKTENVSSYYNVDHLHEAMADNKEITFQYLEWNIKKELEPRKNGQIYRVSPWALTIKDENYYLIAYDDKADMIKHYRVDKMLDIKIVKKSNRLGFNKFKVYDIGTYTNQNFGMFSGQEETVTLQVNEDKVGIILDRFGKNIDIRPLSNNKVSCRVNVLVSKQFFGWVAGIGKDVIILAPKDIRNEYIEYINSILEEYK